MSAKPAICVEIRLYGGLGWQENDYSIVFLTTGVLLLGNKELNRVLCNIFVLMNPLLGSNVVGVRGKALTLPTTMKVNDRQHKELVAQLAGQLNCNEADVNALYSAFASLAKDHCAALDALAIPGFGKVLGVKTMEHVATDVETGKRMLFPPKISIGFEPSTILKTRIAEKGDGDGEQ